MFAHNYFGLRYYPGGYWPPVGGADELVGRKSRPFDGPQPPPIIEHRRPRRGRRIRVVMPDAPEIEIAEDRAREFSANMAVQLGEQTDLAPQAIGMFTKSLAAAIMSPDGFMDIRQIAGENISANLVREIAIAALASTLAERFDEEDDAEAVLIMLLNS